MMTFGKMICLCRHNNIVGHWSTQKYLSMMLGARGCPWGQTVSFLIGDRISQPLWYSFMKNMWLQWYVSCLHLWHIPSYQYTISAQKWALNFDQFSRLEFMKKLNSNFLHQDPQNNNLFIKQRLPLQVCCMSHVQVVYHWK